MIVFDNYQDAPFESIFHEILYEALSIIPQNISIIMISRKAPHPAYSSFKREGDMATIGWDDLCLTGIEPKGIAKALGLDKFDDKLLKQLNNRAEGWISGLLLMLGNVDRDKKTVISFVGAAPEMMFDYFSSEIFQKMDSETQSFLSQTSILPYMTSKMAKDLTGNNQANSILAQLNHNNFFTVIKEDQSEQVYQYHQLFQEFLLTRAKEAFEPAFLSELQKRAADLLEESGQILDAGELLCKFKASKELGRLICRHAKKILAQGMNRLLWRWLENISHDVTKVEPWLLYWQGAVCMLINPSDSLYYFERSFQVFKTNNDKKGMLVTISGAINAITNELNDLSTLEKWFKELDQVKDIINFSSPGKIELQISGNIFFAMVLAYPDHPDFDKWMNVVIYLFNKSTNPNQKILIAWPLGVHYYWIGDFANTKLVAETLQKLSKTEQITPLTFILAKITASLCFFVTANFKESIEEANAGLEMSRTSGVHLWDLMLLAYCIGGSVGLANLENARVYLKKAEAIIKKNYNNHHGMAYHMMVSWEAILRKDYTNAKMHAEISLKLGMALKATLTLAMGHYQVSQMSHKLGEYKKADEHLREAFRIAARMKSSFIEFMCRIGKAQFALDRGENKRGVKCLREAMALGRENNLVNFYYWQPDVMAKLCVKALENGIENEFVHGLIRKRNLVPETPPVNLLSWPWKLKIYSLGQFSILKDEKVLQFSGKTPRKPVLLLKTLIAYGSNGVSDKQLTDLLWPEADGDAAYNAFSVTLKRLREVIGIDGIITLNGGRVMVDPYLCWVDAWDFEQTVMEINDQNKDWTKKTSTSIIKLTEKAIDTYKGTFLENDVENPQQLTYGNCLKGKFINCINSLGFYLEQKGNLKKAVNCYQKGLEVDSTSEMIYQRLMISYQKLGHQANAITTYEQCKQSILMAFGTDVSKETVAIYTNIKEGKIYKNR